MLMFLWFLSSLTKQDEQGQRGRESENEGRHASCHVRQAPNKHTSKLLVNCAAHRALHPPRCQANLKLDHKWIFIAQEESKLNPL